MSRFAEFTVVPAPLAGFAPTLHSYAASCRSALALDGAVYPPSAEVLVTQTALMPVEPEPWRLPSLTDVRDYRTVSDAAIAAVEECILRADAATPQLGTAACRELRGRMLAMAMWVLEQHEEAEGPIERFATAMLFRVRREFLREYGARRLWLELRDERQRDAARQDPVAREAYLWWWYGRIGKLQRKLAWHVPGYSGEDVAGELLARLIEALDNGNDVAFEMGAPGVEGTFAFLVRKKRWLQRRQQIRQVIPREAFGTIGERTPTGEDLVMAKEQRAQAEAVLTRAKECLRPRQHRYFDAVLADARKHHYVSEVRIAEKLGVHKSTVSRAVKLVISALNKSGAPEFTEGMNRHAPRAKRRLWRADRDPTEPEHAVDAAPTRPSRPLPPVPQPPWLDVGDDVALRGTGDLGVVTGVDYCIVGALYRVRFGSGERCDLTRDALEYRAQCDVPF